MTQKLISARVENVMGCKLGYAKINANGVTIVGGDNGNGKSSFINSILIALGGKKAFPPDPINRESDDGKIELHLSGDEGTLLPWPCTVTRTFERDTSGGMKTNLEITADDGQLAPTPQTILTAITSQGLGIDPIAAAKKDPRELVEILKNLAGLDFRELDKDRQKLYDNRARVNREVKQFEGSIAKMLNPTDVPRERIVVSELVTQLDKIRDHNKLQEERAETVDELRAQLNDTQSEIARLKKQEAKLQNDIVQCVAPEELKDDKEIRQQIASAEKRNEQFDAQQKRLERIGEKQAKKRESDELSSKIKDIDKRKAKMARDAEWPISGLAFSHAGLTYQDTPVEQLSFTERCHLTIGLQFALSPHFPFVIVWDGANLLPAALRALTEIAQQHGGQVVMEKPTTDPKQCHVIFEEGVGREAELTA